jgi:uncharacterized protein YbjT (DUF2867 family)
VARVLIVGCGCRGRALAAELVDRGHAVRGTTRRPERRAEIAAAGAEPWVADPQRMGSLLGAIEGVSVLCWLLASATGPADAVAALHAGLLQRLLEEIVDTPVRGVVYEAAGTVDPAVLAGAAELVRQAHETWHIPSRILRSDPADHRAWVDGAAGSVAALLGGQSSRAPA